MKLNRRSKLYRTKIEALKKARAARSRNAKARRSIIIPEVKMFQREPVAYHTKASENSDSPTVAKLLVKRDRLNVAIEVLRELEG